MLPSPTTVVDSKERERDRESAGVCLSSKCLASHRPEVVAEAAAAGCTVIKHYTVPFLLSFLPSFFHSLSIHCAAMTEWKAGGGGGGGSGKCTHCTFSERERYS